MTTLPTTPTRERTEELASERWPDLRVSEVESVRADANLFKHYWLNVQAFAHRTGAIAGTNIIEWLRDYPNLTKENARLAERVRVLEEELKKIRSVIPMNFLIAHDTPGATGPTDALDLVGAIRSLVHNARKWEDRARSALSQKDGEAPKQ